MQVFNGLIVDGTAVGSSGVDKLGVTITDCVATSTQVDVVTSTIGADEWADGELILIYFAADYKNQSGAAATLTIKLHYGTDSYTIVSTSLANTGVVTRYGYQLHLWRIGNDIRVAGDDYVTGMFVNAHPGSVNAITGSDSYASGRKGAILTAPGFGTSKTLKITAQWDVADVNTFYSVRGAKILKM